MYPCSTNTREVLNKLRGGIYNTSHLYPRQPIPADVSLPLSLFLATAVEDGWTQVTVAPEPYVFANPCPPSMRGVRISELSSVDIRSHQLVLNIIVIQPLNILSPSFIVGRCWPWPDQPPRWTKTFSQSRFPIHHLLHHNPGWNFCKGNAAFYLLHWWIHDLDDFDPDVDHQVGGVGQVEAGHSEGGGGGHCCQGGDWPILSKSAWWWW